MPQSLIQSKCVPKGFCITGHLDVDGGNPLSPDTELFMEEDAEEVGKFLNLVKSTYRFNYSKRA